MSSPNTEGKMVLCEVCGKWYHEHCVTDKPEIFIQHNSHNKSYVRPVCSAQSSDETCDYLNCIIFINYFDRNIETTALACNLYCTPIEFWCIFSQ